MAKGVNGGHLYPLVDVPVALAVDHLNVIAFKFKGLGLGVNVR